MFRKAIVLVVWAVCIRSTVGGEVRKWTDASNKFSVNAELVEINGDTVVLKKDDGQSISVPRLKLSAADQAYLATSEMLPKARIAKLMATIQDADTSYRAKQDALKELGDIGAEAESAIPLLLRIATESKGANREEAYRIEPLREEAGKSLGRIGPKAVPALATLAERTTEDRNLGLINAVFGGLSKLGSDASAACPALLKLVILRPMGPKERLTPSDRLRLIHAQQVIKTLPKIGVDPKELVPRLVAILEKPVFDPPGRGFNPNGSFWGLDRDWNSFAGVCIKGLATLGPAAQDAVPTLVKYLRADVFAEEALVALNAIGPDARFLNELRDLKKTPVGARNDETLSKIIAKMKSAEALTDKVPAAPSATPAEASAAPVVRDVPGTCTLRGKVIVAGEISPFDKGGVALTSGRGLPGVFIWIKTPPKETNESGEPLPPLTLTVTENGFERPTYLGRVGQKVSFQNPSPYSSGLEASGIYFHANISLPPGQMSDRAHRFEKRENFPFRISARVALQDKIIQHEAHLLVLDHSFAAATDREGVFAIAGIPSGEYTFRAWHPMSGSLPYIDCARGKLECDKGGTFSLKLDRDSADLGGIKFPAEFVKRK